MMLVGLFLLEMVYMEESRRGQMVGGNRQCSEFTDDMESLLELFEDVSNLLIKTEFVVYDEPEITEAADLLIFY